MSKNILNLLWESEIKFMRRIAFIHYYMTKKARELKNQSVMKLYRIKAKV
jgi:hypothetical protein